MDQTAAVLIELGRQEPQTAVALAWRVYQRVADKSKPFTNARDPTADATNAEADFSDSEAADNTESDFATTSNHDAAFEHSKAEIQSFMKPSNVDQRSLRNRKLRGALFDDIILMLLLANPDRDLIASDIKNEFTRLQIQVGDTALLSRIARLREDEVLERVSVTGTGLYRLSADGKKIAQNAKGQRVADGP